MFSLVWFSFLIFWSTPEAALLAQAEPLVIKQNLYSEETIRKQEVAEVEKKQTSVPDIRPELSQDKNIQLNSSVIASIYSKENFILDSHFDPQSQGKVSQDIQDPILNLYGIKELVGLGVSDFSGSSRNRRKNIEIALKKFDGVVVGVGKQFSFNDILKSVEAEEGFVKEKVVLDGKGAYALGGGICQLSTTIYRAALNSGLKIDTRRGHTYAYDKYLPHGLDATIYLGSQDLVFTNDTAENILIKPYIDGNKLIVAVFGTKDGRTVNIKRTNYTNYRFGGLVTNWSRVIKKDGKEIAENIASTYKGIN